MVLGGEGVHCLLLLPWLTFGSVQCPVIVKLNGHCFRAANSSRSLANDVQIWVGKMLDIGIHQINLCSAYIKYQENQLCYPVDRDPSSG